uniref:Protein FAM136A n=1 Tax=Chenopodium quinoa TaxID=63459 RepID=A0A803KTQ4_CHEQI
MNHIANAEEQIVTERLRRKLNEVNSSAQSQLSGVQDHINFTLQQAYFKCAYNCFDRRRSHEEISNCVEHCSVPVMQAQNLVEVRIITEKLQRALMVCQDRYESAKLQPGQSNSMNDLESCVSQTIDDSVKTLPSLVERLKTSLGMYNST